MKGMNRDVHTVVAVVDTVVCLFGCSRYYIYNTLLYQNHAKMKYIRIYGVPVLCLTPTLNICVHQGFPVNVFLS